jgi:hypothetical protein
MAAIGFIHKSPSKDGSMPDAEVHQLALHFGSAPTTDSDFISQVLTCCGSTLTTSTSAALWPAIRSHGQKVLTGYVDGRWKSLCASQLIVAVVNVFLASVTEAGSMHDDDIDSVFANKVAKKHRTVLLSATDAGLHELGEAITSFVSSVMASKGRQGGEMDLKISAKVGLRVRDLPVALHTACLMRGFELVSTQTSSTSLDEYAEDSADGDLVMLWESIRDDTIAGCSV